MSTAPSLPRPRDLLALLLLCVVGRACVTLALSAFGRLDYDTDLAADSAMYVVLFLACTLLLRNRKRGIAQTFAGLPGSTLVAIGVLAGIVQVMFTLGENGAEAWALSQFDRMRAYQLWHFREMPLHSAPFLSARVLEFILVTCLLGPVVEEFFFRGLLFRSLLPGRGLHRAALASSLLFVLLHFANAYYLSTLVFAMCQCYAYILWRSLWVPVTTHVVFNIASFIHQGYFDFHWTRGIDDMVSLAAWKPEVACLAISLAVGAWAAITLRRPLASATLF